MNVARLKFRSNFRSLLSEKLMELGNLTIGALALGQFVTGKEFSFAVFISGIIFGVICYLISYFISS